MADFDPNEFLRGAQMGAPKPVAGPAPVPTWERAPATIAPPAATSQGFDANKFVQGSQMSARVQPPPGVGLTEDLARSAYKGTLMGPVTFPGIPGSISRFVTRDAPEAAKNLFASSIPRALDLIPPATAESIRQTPIEQGPLGSYMPWLKSQTPEQRAGERDPLFNLPTVKGERRYYTELAREGLIAPEFLYEPETIPGKMAEAAGESIVGSAPGPARTAASRIFAGAGAAGAARGVEAIAPDSGLAPVIAAIGGGLAGEGLYNTLGSIAGRLIPGGTARTARTALYDAIARDLRADPVKARQLRAAFEAGRGNELTIFDFAGKETNKLLRDRAVTGKFQDELTNLTGKLVDRKADAPTISVANISQHYGAPSGQILNAGDITSGLVSVGRSERDRAYKAAMDQADASGEVFNLSDLGDPRLVNSPMFQDAMKRATARSKDPGFFHIQPPDPNAFVSAPGGVLVRGSPGNLAFYDQVKKELGFVERAALKAEDGATAMSAGAARKALTNALDAKFEKYGLARDIASRTFRAEDAPGAGLNFYRATDTFTKRGLRDNLSMYTPEQLQSFRMGFASGVVEDLSKGKADDLYKNFFQSPEFRDRAMLALGEDDFNVISGNIAAQKIAQNFRALPSMKGEVPGLMGKEGLIPAVTGATAAALMDAAATGMVLGPSAGTSIISGATVAGVLKGLKNHADRKFGEKLIGLALDNNPKSLRRLGEMLNREPSAMRMFDRILGLIGPRTTTAAQAAGAFARSYGPEDQPSPELDPNRPRPLRDALIERLGGATVGDVIRHSLLPEERSAAGRVGRASGGRISTMNHAVKAAALVRLAEKAKKMHSSQTEGILDQPDTVVAKALAKANDAI